MRLEATRSVERAENIYTLTIDSNELEAMDLTPGERMLIRTYETEPEVTISLRLKVLAIMAEAIERTFERKVDETIDEFIEEATA